ncbi:MAG: twin-arginine translocation signal domain-containing protein [Phycisphaerae bacterium]|nr:twin-arginine translocation signal domain-containing protein [Phycisphaerae bacterium]NUQ44725.1 twin-arginine translocation signal domain-containing protein [Phycisphaerae bacterium]
MTQETRRDFMGQVGKTALAGGAVMMGAGATMAQPAEAEAHPSHGRQRRRVVPGSPSPVYSRAVAFGDLVWVAGVVGVKPGTKEIPRDVADEIRQALDNLKESVESADSRLDNVLKCTVFLKDYDHFKTFNEVYQSYFPKRPPARSTVVVKDFVVPGARIEIDCVTCVQGPPAD